MWNRYYFFLLLSSTSKKITSWLFKNVATCFYHSTGSDSKRFGCNTKNVSWWCFSRIITMIMAGKESNETYLSAFLSPFHYVGRSPKSYLSWSDLIYKYISSSAFVITVNLNISTITCVLFYFQIYFSFKHKVFSLTKHIFFPKSKQKSTVTP